ncbi:MAG TPA: transcriptional regulator [Terriglobales bacterium]|nr:transcriptional regulator [Terriglobales bacterium]
MTKANFTTRRTIESKEPLKESKAKPRKPAPAEPALELDRIIHERLRLGILSALAVNASLTFNDLKKLLQTSDGNLSVHARKLEEAEYIACEKSFTGRVPKTEYRMTGAGKKALERYLDEMEELIRTTRKAQR